MTGPTCTFCQNPIPRPLTAEGKYRCSAKRWQSMRYCDQGCYKAHKTALTIEKAQAKGSKSKTRCKAVKPPICKQCHKEIPRGKRKNGKAASLTTWLSKTYCDQACYDAHRGVKGAVAARWTPPDLNTGEYYAMPQEATGERCERHPDQHLNAFGQCPVCAAVARQRAPADVEVFYTIDAVT